MIKFKVNIRVLFYSLCEHGHIDLIKHLIKITEEYNQGLSRFQRFFFEQYCLQIDDYDWRELMKHKNKDVYSYIIEKCKFNNEYTIDTFNKYFVDFCKNGNL